MLNIDRILLVGLGSIGKRHLGNIQQLFPHAQLAVLRSSKQAAHVVGCEVFSSIDEALAFQPQLAFICNPSTFHISVAIKLAEIGTHLFIEKPLSSEFVGIDEFIQVVKRSNVKVMVGYNLRFNPSLLRFREELYKAEYGSVLTVSAEVGQYLPSWRPDVDYRSTVSARASLGGGALLELSHELDYLIWLFGQAVSVSARLLKVSALDIDVEDLVLAHIEFVKEQRKVITSIQLDFLQRKPARICKAVCENATIVWDAIAGRVDVFLADGTQKSFQDKCDRNFTYEQELRTFIESIDKEVPVLIDVEDGRRVLELVDAMRKSSESGRVVKL